MLRNAQLWGGLVWLAFGIFVAFQGYDLGLGEAREPGSGFAIFWLGLLTEAFALSIVFGAIKGGSEDLASLWRGTRWPKVLLVVVLLLVFGFLFETIGFVLCSLVLLLVLMRVVDPVPWPTALLVSFGATFGTWYALNKLLMIQLPNGWLSPWLG
ncbi:MAG: tripartite tricarboxylate transporter TctB family protein [Hyphomicrobiaceae bacterium]